MKWKKVLVLFLACTFLLSGCEERVLVEKLKETDFDNVITYDVPHFDDTPVALFGWGYLAKVKGKYGFIDNEGKIIVPFQYDRVSHFGNDENITLHSDNKDYPSLGLKYYYPSHKQNEIYRAKMIYAFDVDTNKKYTFKNGKGKECDNFSNASIVYEYVQGHEKELKDVYSVRDVDQYYIYSKENDEMYGPYRSTDVACFALQDDQDTMKYYNDGAHDYIRGLILERVEDGRYRLRNVDSDAVSEYHFDKVDFLSDDSAKVYVGAKQGIVDKDCNLVALGKVDDVSEPINGRTYVKKNGNWQLVKLKPLSHQEMKERANQIVNETYQIRKQFTGTQEVWDYEEHEPYKHIEQLALTQLYVMAKDGLSEEEKTLLKEDLKHNTIWEDNPFLLIEQLGAFFDHLADDEKANEKAKEEM